MWMALLITSYVLFLICLGAFIVCLITGTKILEKKSDAIAAYLVGTIAFGILTIFIYNSEPKVPVENNTTANTETVKTFTVSGGEPTKNNSSNNGKIIGDKDSKIYHVPGSTYYEKELKKLSNNEYFDTVEEAEKAGYRAPKK